ncbi:hypothetical protein QH494_03685 [Sphingomonas sp. AR_OL41]|uniref:hypothetical protein n=1 Tax=Sphingomonas sp. AR_OL41 TaxID=3042729 RepID=UPI00247FC420|nr:hypothetical protein [Sphingomonas sp. AR_OL41]MDH7971271.1 hypothetical protein [Sphingomonas sp. AR_OL41]
MSRWFGLTALIACSAPCAASARQPFFPPNYAEMAVNCPTDDGKEDRTIHFLSSFEQEWFSKHLRAADETPLYSATASSTAKRVVRFTWLRSFSPPVTVRLTERKDGGWHLVAKQLSGRGGYDPGTVDKVVDRALSATEAANLEGLMSRAALPDLSGDCEIGVDGAQWIIERSDAKGYHFINRWSPSDGPVRKVGLFLLNLTGWRLKPVY